MPFYKNKSKTSTFFIKLLFLEIIYRIFRIIKRACNPLIFSKMRHAPYISVRLMCGSGYALSPNYEQILGCNNHYQRNSTSLNSLFLESKLLSCDQITYSYFHSPVFSPFVFSFYLLSFSSRVYLSLHFTCVDTQTCVAHVLQHVRHRATSSMHLTQCQSKN